MSRLGRVKSLYPMHTVQHGYPPSCDQGGPPITRFRILKARKRALGRVLYWSCASQLAQGRMGSLWACGVGLETHGMDYFSRPGVWGGDGKDRAVLRCLGQARCAGCLPLLIRILD